MAMVRHLALKVVSSAWGSWRHWSPCFPARVGLISVPRPAG
jgi:hypothetical protein